jgi:hypothetical protein
MDGGGDVSVRADGPLAVARLGWIEGLAAPFLFQFSGDTGELRTHRASARKRRSLMSRYAAAITRCYESIE